MLHLSLLLSAGALINCRFRRYRKKSSSGIVTDGISSNCLVLFRIHEVFAGEIGEVVAFQYGGIWHLQIYRQSFVALYEPDDNYRTTFVICFFQHRFDIRDH